MIKIPFVKTGLTEEGKPILSPKSPIPDNAIRIDPTETGWVVWQVGDKPPKLEEPV